MQTAFVISAGERPKRLDLFLVHREPKLSRAALQRMIEAGWVRINSRVAKPSQRLKPGDVVCFDSPQPAPLLINGHHQALDILFEDACCLVINKPAGIVCHPGPGHWNDTLFNALLDHLGQTGGDGTIGLVHRLDRETSGVLVVAKTKAAHRHLAEQFEHHTVTREYEALVHGVPQPRRGLIDRGIGPEMGKPTRMSTHTLSPKPSATAYRVEEAFADMAAHLLVVPRTGRTHQIRAHLKSIGHPLLGDSMYGSHQTFLVDGAALPRVMLHARRLGFRHPEHHTSLEYDVDPPEDFQTIRRRLRVQAAEAITEAQGLKYPGQDGGAG
ncbi:MAG: RluA family pseudouridine synthase [Nitrospira sp.]|nr:RluA family pseudouridine synthase [Nitrospira sp.]